jgi:hypothetical protein
MTTKTLNVFDRSIELITTLKADNKALKAENADLKAENETLKVAETEATASISKLDELLTAKELTPVEPATPAEPTAPVEPTTPVEPVVVATYVNPIDVPPITL